MCIQHVEEYALCPHKVSKKLRCENFRSKPRIRCQKELRPETNEGLCPKCESAPLQEPTVTWIDVESIPSWITETSASIDTASNLESGVELLRKGSQRAMGGMKKLMRSVRSKRGSYGSPSQREAVSSEVESPSGGENAALCLRESEPLAESKTAKPSSQARALQRVTENSSAQILANTTTTMTASMDVLRPSGRDVETATVVTANVASQAYGDRDRRVEELARADERLARVRDGRGYINFNLI
jgi:hypothetical protein